MMMTNKNVQRLIDTSYCMGILLACEIMVLGCTAKLEEQNKTLYKQNTALYNENEKLKRDFYVLTDKFSSLEKSNSVLTCNYTKLHDENLHLMTLNECSSNSIIDLQCKCHSLSNEISKFQGEYNSLSKRFEQFKTSVKFDSSAKNKKVASDEQYGYNQNKPQFQKPSWRNNVCSKCNDRKYIKEYIPCPVCRGDGIITYEDWQAFKDKYGFYPDEHCSFSETSNGDKRMRRTRNGIRCTCVGRMSFDDNTATYRAVKNDHPDIATRTIKRKGSQRGTLYYEKKCEKCSL